MNRGKEVYDRIEIPAELSERVNKTIASVDRKKAEEKAKIRKRNHRITVFIRTAGVTAASFLICLLAGVNSSQVLAEGIGGLPVIGPLAQVLTVRSYEEQNESVSLQAKVPNIRMGVALAADTAAPEEGVEEFALTDSAKEVKTEDAKVESDYVADINKEIDTIVEDFIAQAKQDMEDYREAFFTTGGTEEEWAQRTMDIHVDYEVKYQEGARLSMVLHVDECWVSFYQEDYYYNLDLESQKDITLEDMLGEDYIRICNDSILAQIKEQVETDENKMYFGYGPYAEETDEMKFTTITDNTNFYINKEGNVVICFAKYEIAPGYMGVCEFEIRQ